MAESPQVSFELNEEMLTAIENEFSPEKIAADLAEAISDKNPEAVEAIGKEMFTRYGTDLIERSYELGEAYPDRTYEMIRETAERTGSILFPLAPQRFLEIAYLSTQHISTLPVLANSSSQFIFQIRECKIYDQVKNKAGDDVARRLTCRHACLTCCEAIFGRFGFADVNIDMTAATNAEGYCEFVVARH